MGQPTRNTGLGLLVLVLVVVVTASKPSGHSIGKSKPSGYLVHVSDFHYDPLYDSRFNSSTSCRSPEPPRTGLKGKRMKFADDFSPEEKERQKLAAELGRLIARRRPHRDNSAPFGNYGCDSPLSLIDATMDQLKAVAPNPDWVFVTGDYAAHGLTGVGNYTFEAMATTTSSLESVYPQSSIYFCFGNNDVPEKNYNIDCSSSWFSQVYELWQDYIPIDQKETFLKMGGYRANLSFGFPPSETSSSPLRLLVLNTLFYSTRSNHQNESDPCGQFDWLSNQLQEASDEGAQVYLMSHIMPGMDSYKFVSLWEDDFNTRFFDVVTPYRDIIAGQFYGHVHNDEFRAYNDIPSSSSVAKGRGKVESSEVLSGLVNSAVSPVYGNNPNFRLASYSNEDFTVTDFTIWAMDLGTSNEEGRPLWSNLYSFVEAYGVGRPDHSGIVKFDSKILDDYSTFRLWYQHRSSGSNTDYAPDEGSPGWGCLICAMDSEGVEEFNECIANLQITSEECASANS